MEALDHEVVAIVKGKRTKRQRFQSSDGDGYYDGEKALVVVNMFSPSTSSAEYYDRDGTTTEEEEDMANCLILLAQGNHQPKRSSVSKSPAATAEDDQEYGKFTSRKYLETDTGSGKVGYYVYECKTCNRTFPSFQALGGHRASHKKPKTNPTPVAVPSSDEEDRTGEFKKYSSLSLQLGSSGSGNGNIYGHTNNAANNPGKQGKVHECSICGAEFASGQALGGHMRRHRAPPALPLPQIGIAKLVNSKDEATTATATPTTSLDLDLNLPAPEDQNPENPFLQRQQQKKQPSQAATTTTALVFSAAAMVDCHY